MPASRLAIVLPSGNTLARDSDISAMRTFVAVNVLAIYVRPHTAAYRALVALTPTESVPELSPTLVLDGRVIAKGYLARNVNVDDFMAVPIPGNTGFFYQGRRYFAFYEALSDAPSAARDHAMLVAALLLVAACLAGYIVCVGPLANWKMWSAGFLVPLVAGVSLPWVVAYVHVRPLPGQMPSGLVLVGGMASVIVALFLSLSAGLLKKSAFVRSNHGIS